MAHGTVTSFDATYGYGFIAVDGLADDVFVHVSAIASPSLRSLSVGQRVAFDLVTDLPTPRAANVTLAGRSQCRALFRARHLGAAVRAEPHPGSGWSSAPSVRLGPQCYRGAGAQVSATTAGRPGYSCTLSRLLDAPVAKVWEVWTQPEHFARWFNALPSTVCLDVRPGGSWRATRIASDGTEHPMSGSYDEVITHRRLVATLDLPDRPEPAVTNIGFTDLGDQTKVVLTQTIVTGTETEQATTSCALVLEGVSGYLATV